MAANPETSQYHEVTPERLIHYTDHAPLGASNGTAIFIHGSGPGASGWSNFKHNVSAFKKPVIAASSTTSGATERRQNRRMWTIRSTSLSTDSYR